jgi:hypothetical protein
MGDVKENHFHNGAQDEDTAQVHDSAAFTHKKQSN